MVITNIEESVRIIRWYSLIPSLGQIIRDIFTQANVRGIFMRERSQGLDLGLQKIWDKSVQPSDFPRILEDRWRPDSRNPRSLKPPKLYGGR